MHRHPARSFGAVGEGELVAYSIGGALHRDMSDDRVAELARDRRCPALGDCRRGRHPVALAVTHWDGQGRVCGSVNAAPRAVNAFADARQTGVNDG
jgi:dihydrodipicolinate synthase/N-acetylneuraminate lyase